MKNKGKFLFFSLLASAAVKPYPSPTAAPSQQFKIKSRAYTPPVCNMQNNIQI